MNLQEGLRIQDRYEVIRPLGEGGMGAAHLVLDTRLNRQCVIKEILSRSTISKVQFEREAQILANLQHTNLPVVYDIFFDEESPFIVMQFIEGTTLNRLAAGRDAPFEIHDVLKWAKEILAAMVHMHTQTPPIIHRDIKPHNICITPENKAVLLDFGIARRLDESQTRTAAQAVTQNYSPIEQYPEQNLQPTPSVLEYVQKLHSDGFRTNFYSDVYGLGATLYYALTLLSPTDVRMRVLNERLISIQEKNPEVPKFLAMAVMKALSLHPNDRFQSADEMLAALQPESIEAPVVPTRRRTARSQPTSSLKILDQELIYIPQGRFTIGTDDPQLKAACRPGHEIKLGAFCIARTPVTHADYQRFIEDNPDYSVPNNPMRFAQRYNWDLNLRAYPRGLNDHPVVLISWQDALEYCRWLSKVSGYEIRLPSEAQWEKAASWETISGKARLYPWGDQFAESNCNVDVHGDLRLQTSPVGRFSPQGDSPFGIVDMAGNVWEWTNSLYMPYPYNPEDGRESRAMEGKRVARGGAYDEGPLMARCAWRNAVQTDLRLANVGFRIACDAAD
ncbi:MAG: SUMF1/EgtB/PvdO family nonheme iron enzyme [Anaerolineales bacterium]|nr:SUMF1/EgtB/PvdO family nonheme iron enzyme [Anaerolineales bacterium]